ncbi:hypothetical protein V492_03073 [Pseudogymnoascus sp. VKM F-4246]|nr:hypothetical protein V492_03073 [Pseudogymnoascus sp. VKM F-4246]
MMELNSDDTGMDTNQSNKTEQDNSRHEWALKSKVAAFQERDRASGLPGRHLGITWKDLTVEVKKSHTAVHENVLSQLNIPKLIKESRHEASLKTILDNSHGCVKPGEMLLVLGRPGSGCTTLLNVLANQRNGYGKISGDVHYGTIEAEDAKRYSGQIIVNGEEEIFFPALTVRQTMDFATRLKKPFHLPDGVASREDLRIEMRDFLLESMGIEHTINTKVGDAYIRGVSGGERKRVSIVECLASKGSIFCWDNATRGLDASNALEYVKAIRAMTDILGLSSIFTLYQAGNGIYNLFDKVLVLDEGKQIYYGPRASAQPFMEQLGFICGDGANVADYLTGITVPTERKIQKDQERIFPRTSDAVREAYKSSPIHKQMITEYDYPLTEDAIAHTASFSKGVAMEKDRRLPGSSPMMVGFLDQVTTCIHRQYQILWGDKATFSIKQISTVVQALMAGSLFYNAPDTSAGLFMKSGACFFAIFFNALMSMSEVTDSFTGRPVILKHRSFAFFHPAALCIAQIATDIPVVLFQVSVFCLVLYFMVGLTMTAGAFFTFWAVVVATTMCMTAFFRGIGASAGTFDKASKVSGFIIVACMMYLGYMIPKPAMHPWFVWLFWINPMAYGFDAILSNEFHNKIIPCVGNNLIPSSPGDSYLGHQACAGVGGAIPRQTFVHGDDYLASLSYSHDHIWRNFGIVWAWWALFVALTIWSTSKWAPSTENGPRLVIPRERTRSVVVQRQIDEEGQVDEKRMAPSGSDVEANTASEEGQQQTNLIRNSSIFTWKNLSYTVKTRSGDLLLLNNVQGYVKPGNLTALMGSSGAGKSTLLDVLAQRKTEGTIRGSIMLDGQPLPISFQRSVGYCEQLDVHEPYATVREALEFSALLRQSRESPREEKLAYVETIIDLLELHDLADTLIGQEGTGLSIEQRKRVTIGIELVSKPGILFLDEPTSGLDGQSAFHTVRFLRKLAAVGQAVLVTIHQPSAQLFAQFDSLLLLAKGGKTVYFGEIGEMANTVRGYFGQYGAACPANVNPAEHIIDVVSGTLSGGKDWNSVWLASPEYKAMSLELDQIIKDAASKPPSKDTADDREFAMPLWEQIKLVTHRMNVSLYRNTEYVNNKVMLHIICALLNGFSFWKVGESASELQLKLFAIFNFIFVAPGVLAQLQPLFIHRRDIYEAREKKAKMYSWVAFVTGLIVSEIPYLIFCAIIYFLCWYYTVGFPATTSRAGATFFVMLMYEFLYTGMGQFIAAYAPNAVFAALTNPMLIGALVSFCGVLVPYSQIQEFWRYWIYYLNPFNYLMGSLLVFNLWGVDVKCTEAEFAIFNPPDGQTCGEYMTNYLNRAPGHLANPEATADCKVCPFGNASDYLKTLYLEEYSYGWRNAGIVVLMVFSSYGLVYALMKLRTKTSKTAE